MKFYGKPDRGVGDASVDPVFWGNGSTEVPPDFHDTSDNDFARRPFGQYSWQEKATREIRMTQRDIRTWNDAVAACLEAAMAEVDALEAEAGDGMASPARTVVRAVSRQLKPGDDRRRLDERQSAKLLELLAKPG